MNRSFTKYITYLRPGPKEATITTRSKIFSHLSATLMAALFVFALLQFDLFALRGLLVDLLFRVQLHPKPVTDIVLIGYDDDAAFRSDGSSKLPTKELQGLLDILSEDRPLATVLIAPVNERLYSEVELNTLATSFAKLPNAFIGYTDDESLAANAPQALLHTVKYLPGYVSRDSFSYGADSVSRRVMLSIDGIPTVYAKVAELYRAQKGLPPLGRSKYERLAESQQTYIHWQGPPGTYAYHSSTKVIDRSFPTRFFKDKIVLISSVLESKKGADHVFTPFSREHFKTPLLEGAAHSLATLINDIGISKTSALFNILLAFFIGIITVNMVLFLSPGRGIFFVLGEVLVLFVISWIALLYYNTWINIAHPLLIAGISYYLVIPYRLVDEYRKRWHYQEKSELMTQLERLKSNFLSLISHDLKTPIARIQGNAELLLNPKSPLSSEQKKSLDAIVDTTEGLGQYVQTVLDLTRIESSQVPLSKVSKDINSIVREVVQSKKTLAMENGIELITKLDPLFSIKFDPKLIRQVIANLLENAIKYSQSGTHITLASKEEGDWVKIDVIDEGLGIAPDEQEKVFSKFYRSSNPLVAEIKGTGLGLYLVKYFVELHKGTVELKSELGHGSRFTIALPV